MKRTSLNAKQKQFLSKLVEHGEADIGELKDELGLTRQSIYNYFEEIKNLLTIERQKGKLYLYLKDEAGSDTFVNRLLRNQDLKKKIADYVVDRYIEPGDAVFMDCGSTVSVLADTVKEREVDDLTVYTVNPYVLTLQSYKKLRRLAVFGGTLNGDAGSIAGPWVMTLLEELKSKLTFRRAFLGVDGLSLVESSREIRMTLSNDSEIEQKLKIMEMSEEVYVLLDSSKIGAGGVTLQTYNENNRVPGHVKFVLGLRKADQEKAEKIRSLKDILGDKLELVEVDAQ